MLNPSLNKSTSVGVVGFSATHQATQEGSQAPTLHAPATGKTEPWCGVEPAGARYLPQPLSAPAGEHQESAAWGRHPWVEGTLQKSSLWSRESGLPSENKKNELLHWPRQEKSSSRPLPGSGKAWGWRLPSGNGAQWAGSQLPQLRGTPLEETCFSPAAPWVWRQGLPGWEKEEIRKEIRMSQGVKGTWFRQVASRTPAGSPPGDPPLRPPTWPLGTPTALRASFPNSGAPSLSTLLRVWRQPQQPPRKKAGVCGQGRSQKLECSATIWENPREVF